MSKKLEQLLADARNTYDAGNYEQAIKTLLKANDLAEKSGDVLDRFETLTALGSTYARAGQPQKALLEYTRAMNLCVFADLGAFAAGACLASTSHVYFDLDMAIECEETAKNSLQILKQDLGKDPSAVLMPLEVLIKLNLKVANHKLARTYISQAIEIAKKHPGFNSQSAIETIMSKLAALPEDTKALYEDELADLPKPHDPKHCDGRGLSLWLPLAF